LRLFVAGVIFLAAVAIVSMPDRLSDSRVEPGAESRLVPESQPTADVLALGGIVNYVLAFKSPSKKGNGREVWLAGLALICIALVISYSRAGILMFFAGIGFWHLGSLFRPRKARIWPWAWLRS
jgi:hypothetical protein